jgi:hypothetical protein
MGLHLPQQVAPLGAASGTTLFGQANRRCEFLQKVFVGEPLAEGIDVVEIHLLAEVVIDFGRGTNPVTNPVRCRQKLENRSE